MTVKWLKHEQGWYEGYSSYVFVGSVWKEKDGFWYGVLPGSKKYFDVGPCKTIREVKALILGGK